MTPAETASVEPHAGSVDPTPPSMEHGASNHDLRGSIRRGVVWAAVSNIVMRSVGIGVTALVARILSPSEFGTFAIALAVFVVITSLAELGMASAVARSPLEPVDTAGTVTTISIAVSTGLAIAMVLGAQPLATVLGAQAAADPIRILGLCLVLTGFFAVPGAQLTRDFRQDRILLATLAGFVPSNALLVVLALMGHGADAFAWSRVLGQLVTGLVFVAFLDKRYRPQWRPELVLPLLTFGLPLALANLINWTLLNADYLIIARLLDPQEVGVYMIAFTVANWSTALLGSVLNGVVLPAFGRLGDDHARLHEALATATRLVALVALPMAATTIALAPSLVRTMFGTQWMDAAPVLAILGLYGACFAFTLVLVNMLVAIGATGRLLAVQLTWAGALVPAMVVGVRVGGLTGAAWSHVVVVVLVALPGFMWALRSKLRGMSLALVGTVWSPALASAAAAIAAWWVDRWVDGPAASFVLGGLTALAVYLLGASRMIARSVPEYGRLLQRGRSVLQRSRTSG